MTNQMKNKLATCHEQVQAAYLNGATLREIGDVHGVSAGTVRNCLLEIGIALRPRGRRKKAVDGTTRNLPLNELPANTPDTE